MARVDRLATLPKRKAEFIEPMEFAPGHQAARRAGMVLRPLEGDKLEAAQTKFGLADAYRTAVMGKDQKAKEQARKDIDDARKAGTISVNDEQQMMLAPYKYPTRLAATAAHSALEDALDAAGVQEKRDICSEIAKKVTSYYASVTSGKHNEKEYKALKLKIDKFFVTGRNLFAYILRFMPGQVLRFFSFVSG